MVRRDILARPDPSPPPRCDLVQVAEPPGARRGAAQASASASTSGG